MILFENQEIIEFKFGYRIYVTDVSSYKFSLEADQISSNSKIYRT